jgi:hypothetical protein
LSQVVFRQRGSLVAKDLVIRSDAGNREFIDTGLFQALSLDKEATLPG